MDDASYFRRGWEITLVFRPRRGRTSPLGGPNCRYFSHNQFDPVRASTRFGRPTGPYGL
jgi:hypothetical protein